MTFRHIINCIVCTSAVTAFCACSRPQDRPVPRRTAYPRLQLYDSVYSAAKDIPLRLLVNHGAEVSTRTTDGGAVWVTAEYPAYNASVMFTLTPVDVLTVHRVIDNRTERIHLNAGSQLPAIEEGDNPAGYHYNIVYAPSVPTTPLQFIAAHASCPEWVVSGAAYFRNAGPATSVDSVTPVYEALYRDIKVALDSLSAL